MENSLAFATDRVRSHDFPYRDEGERKKEREKKGNKIKRNKIKSRNARKSFTILSRALQGSTTRNVTFFATSEKRVKNHLSIDRSFIDRFEIKRQRESSSSEINPRFRELTQDKR